MDTMWATFHSQFHYDRRPRQALAFVVQAMPQPQNYPRDVVEAAIAASKATEAKPPGKRRKAA